MTTTTADNGTTTQAKAARISAEDYAERLRGFLAAVTASERNTALAVLIAAHDSKTRTVADGLAVAARHLGDVRQCKTIITILAGVAELLPAAEACPDARAVHSTIATMQR